MGYKSTRFLIVLDKICTFTSPLKKEMNKSINNKEQYRGNKIMVFFFCEPNICALLPIIIK